MSKARSLPEGVRAGRDWRVAGLSLALAVITFMVFGQTVGHGFVNFDDNDYVVNNPVVARGLTGQGFVWAFTHFYASNWHPLTWLSHMLDCQMYGLEPGGHHLTSVVLHAGNAVMLFLALWRMTGALWRSAFVAAVFAVHPLRAESVAWVAERKDVLSGFFFMLTIWAYTSYARHEKSPRRYGLVALSFAMGLLCKPMLVTLPLVLLLLDYWPLQRREPLRRLALEKLPLLALSAASGVTTLLAQKGALRSVESFPLHARLVAALLSYKVYLVQMIYPTRLAAFYPFPRNVPVWVGVMAGVLLAVISAIAFTERRTRPWLLTGWVWYLVMLAPVAGIVQVGGQAHADRYTYLPQIGLYLAVTWLAAEFAAKWQAPPAALGGVMAAVIGILMVCSWRQTAFWQNDETLWTHALDCTTHNNVASVNLGHHFFKTGRLDEAIALYRASLEIDPDNAEYHNNLANALREKGRVDEAIVEYEKAVQHDGAFAEAQFNLGKALLLRGKTEEATARFQKTVQLRPDFPPARISLGTALLQEGQADQAATQFRRVLELRPNDAGMHVDLGLCLFESGHIEEAKAQYETALRLNPADPGIQSNLAWLLATSPEAALRFGDRAVELARQADALTGGENLVVLHTLAAAYAEAGRFPEALETAERAFRLAQAHSNSGLARQLEFELSRYRAGKPFPLRGETAPGDNPAHPPGK